MSQDLRVEDRCLLVIRPGTKYLSLNCQLHRWWWSEGIWAFDEPLGIDHAFSFEDGTLEDNTPDVGVTTRSGKHNKKKKTFTRIKLQFHLVDGPGGKILTQAPAPPLKTDKTTQRQARHWSASMLGKTHTAIQIPLTPYSPDDRQQSMCSALPEDG
jgi:hypothetical protein